MADSNNRGALGKVAALAVLVGLVVFTVGFSTKYWQKQSDVHMGLWGHCVGDFCVEGSWADIFDNLKEGDWSKLYSQTCV